MFWKSFIGLPLLLVATLSPAAEMVFNWAQTKVNEQPAGFVSLLSGNGSRGDWQVLLDEAPQIFPAISANAVNRNVRPVLAQLSRDPAEARYPMLVFDGEQFHDFTLTTRFKIVAGNKEQMAGIAFRIQDPANYYYIRASALGQNVNFFKMQDGQLIGPIGTKAEIPVGAWQELSIQCQGNQIKCSLNGKEVIAGLRDNSFNSGKIGFWTKSDSVSYFGETRILYQPRENLAGVLIRDTMHKYPRLKAVKIFAARPGGSETNIIASSDPSEVGQPAQKEALDVIARGLVYHGEDKGNVLVTMPLRDSNGDSIAAIKFVMKAFPGQTEKNAIARAMPIVKQLESRVRSLADLTQ